MHFHNANNLFFDIQLLASYINGSNSSNPPDQRIKPFTQLLSSTLAGSSSRIHHRRNHNQINGCERNQNTQQGTTAFDLGVGFVLISNDTIHERGVTIYRQGEIWFS
jgi:hypothetical protein